MCDSSALGLEMWEVTNRITFGQMTDACENKDLYTLLFLPQHPELGCK